MQPTSVAVRPGWGPFHPAEGPHDQMLLTTTEKRGVDDRSFTAAVIDGTLNIAFTTPARNPALNAVVIIRN